MLIVSDITRQGITSLIREKLKKAIQDKMLTAILAANYTLVDNTPIWTGRTVLNYQWSYDKPSQRVEELDYQYDYEKGSERPNVDEGSIRDRALAAPQIQLGLKGLAYRTIFCTNSVEYEEGSFRDLEYGNLGTSDGGMMAKAISEAGRRTIR